MKQTARSWRVTVAGLAVGAAGVLGLASPTASADPVYPPRPNPAPAAPMPQAVAVVPGAVGNPMPGTAAAAPVPISPALAPAAQGPGAGGADSPEEIAELLRWLTAGRPEGPVFLTSRRAPAGTPRPDVCPLTGRARLSYRRAAEIFTEVTRPLDPAGRGWTLSQLRPGSS